MTTQPSSSTSGQSIYPQNDEAETPESENHKPAAHDETTESVELSEDKGKKKTKTKIPEPESKSNEESTDEGPLLQQASQPNYSPQANPDEGLKPRIVVIGVGGAGCNAINNMIKSELVGVDFFVANTDAQALEQSDAREKIQLGLEATHGLGAGSHPEMGRASAEESIQHVLERVGGSHMLFVTAGMGGGTGTGAAPVIAKAAREHGILTVGVVTKPFHFEGAKRMRTAETGIEELQKYVDTLIVIPNQNLFRVANEKTTFVDAFKMADEVLYSGVRSVTDLMMKPGLINLDFADVKAVMGEMMGKAMMGTGEAEGDNRAIDAAEAAISSPLLDDVSMKGAKAVLINITGGMDMTLFEADEAANRIREEVDPNAHIIFGSTFDESLQGKIRVSCVATGIDSHSIVAATVSRSTSKISSPATGSDSSHSHSHAGSASAVTSSREEGASSGFDLGGRHDEGGENDQEEIALTPPHLSSVEDELGISFDDEEAQAEPENETTYDIYSSLRQDMTAEKEPAASTPPTPVAVPDPSPVASFRPDPHSFASQRSAPAPTSTPEPTPAEPVPPQPVTGQGSAQAFQGFSKEEVKTPEPQPKPEVNEHEEEHRSFFSRLMGRKKGTPPSGPINHRKLMPPPRPGFQPQRETTATEHDDLDVPAFLRRKDRH